MERFMSKEGDGAEEALLSSEQELRLLVDTIPTLVWTARPEGDIEYVNKRVLEYLGATLDEIIGNGWVEKVHPDDVAFKTRTWLPELATPNPPHAALRFRGADGQYRWFAVSGAPLKAGDGRVLRWYGVMIDIDDRRKAEEAIRESEYKLRQIIDTVPGLIWSTAPDGEPTYVSQRLLDYSGMRFEEFKHRGWEAFMHLADFPATAKAIYHAIQTATSYQGVMRLRRADGEFRWHHARYEPLRDRQGRIIQWYGLSVDIDEAKKAEEQPRSAAQLQATLNVIPTYTWYAAPSGGITFVNKRTADYLGLPKDHPLRLGIDIGAQWDAHIPLLHPDDREESRKAWSTCLRTGEAAEFSQRVRNAQGDYRWFLSRAEPLRATDGTLLQWVGVNLDIEELMRAQEALRESERIARSAIDGIAGLVVVMAPNGELETVNRQVFEYFGRSLEELKNWGTSDAVHPEDLPRGIEMFTRAVASGIPYHYDQRLRRFDGEYRWFDIHGLPIRDDSGRVARWYVLLTDIEDRTRALARLEQMQSDFAHMNRVSMMGELAASLSHEITQPIGAARNYARAALNFLDQQPPDLGEVKKQLGRVVGAADRSGEIIERIRDHIKKAPPRKTHFDLNHAIDEVITLGRSAITRNGVSVQTLLAEGLAPVQGDRVQLQQVVLNLILNAVEAMGLVEAGPRELLISTEQSQTNGALVAVRDSGPWLDPENLERVFEAFYTTKTSGMGMGLSICRSIIDTHGGRLWAGVNEPRGAVFQFTLPDAEKEIMDPRPAALQTRERYEDSASDALRPLAYEDNKRPHRSRRVPDQRRWGRQ